MFEQKKLVRRIGAKELDTVKYRRSYLNATKKDIRLLQRARNAWDNMQDVRERRARCMRFVYGDQWGDYITVYIKGEKKTMTMREYLCMEGNIPMESNQLKKQVNTIVGVLIKEQNEPVCNAIDREEQQYGELLTKGLQANNKKNSVNSIYKLCTLDYLIGGIGICHESYGYREGERRRMDSWTKYIDPNYVIMETTMRDPRMWDMTMIGCWYRMSFNNLAAEVVGHNGISYQQLSEIYALGNNIYSEGTNLDEITEKNRLETLEFMQSDNNNECCVAEIWTLETKERVRLHDYNEGSVDIVDADDREILEKVKRINESRRKLSISNGWTEEETPYIEMEHFVDTFWYCRMLAPDGTILWEEESPYPGRSHPFTIMMTPFIDGRIDGYITDGIEHNIALNRALVLQDWIVRNQVKGFTMIPQQLVPETMTNEEFLQNAIHMGNYLFYDAERLRGVKPEVFHPGAISYDASKYIDQMTRLMESSTAVSGAIQGKTPYSGTSAALFAQQTANSSTPIAAVLEDVREFMECHATKKVKNLAEFYDQKRWELIAGRVDDILGNRNINLNEVSDIEFDVIIRESTSSPVYRAVANDMLLELFKGGAIDFETMLECGDFPFGDTVLQKTQARRAELQAAQQEQSGSGAQVSEQAFTDAMLQKGYGLPVESTRPIVQ